ncbi:ADP-ribosylglycohydrolase family protein [Sphingomonas prati]|uniref:ADP-ribosylglycohydrolase n=1 Tax=Sphingomonas prati TaxID=1843237 RepID=A0A7W9F2R8_9SPHN|nr:ADP-ribosylglycohydrolase family protein [Sphingomonas prati]MBB5730606.1 ADP-ribosylglycohydrolase [Sphingomonas prati]
MSDLTERAMGALMGAAVGDALGVTFEFEDAADIPRERFKMVGGGPFDFAPGAASDDTDLLHAVLRSYTGRNQFDADGAVDNMLGWLDRKPPDVGMQTRYALSCWRDGSTPPDDEDAQGNGGLMRAAAHALACDDGVLAARFAASDTRLTHPSDAAADCSAFYAASVWWAIRGLPPVDSLGRAGDGGPTFKPYEAPKRSGSGHCLHSLRLALWAFTTAETYEAGMDAVIRAGGDTDTNATIAGALLGARFGLAGIPPDWLGGLETCNRDRLGVEAARLRIDRRPNA